MTRRPNARPYDPAEGERRKAEERAASDKARAELDNRVDVIRGAQAQPGETRISRTADSPHRRLDVFALMLERKAITGDHERAVRRLQNDIAKARPLLGTSQLGERVEGAAAPEERAWRAAQQAIARVEALDQAAKALKAVGGTDGLLMVALVVPLANAALTRWRATVERITGETNDHAQGARIRSACQRLTEYYLDLDNAPRRSATVFIGEMISRAEEAA